MKLQSGKRLGPYEIVSSIGAGGMGEVYKAIDTRLDRAVAVKILPAEFASNTQLKLRFEREAKAISALTHPNICTLHDVGSADGIEYLVMELVEGETLADRLARGPIPAAQAIVYAREITDALDKAHRSGITHRDLKPGNIMLTKRGTKLLDFGLAKSAAPAISNDAATSMLTDHRPLTEQGTIVGTFQYMSPEQLEGKEADARSDIFAFGVVLYEMLTGKRAFHGKSRASVIAAILAIDPQPVSALQPSTPPLLDRVVRICLEKDPDDRWQTAHDLKLQLDGLDLNATETTAVPSHPRPRPRAMAGWLVAAAIALVAASFIAWHFSEHEPPMPIALNIAAPEGANFNTIDGPAVLSPDGKRLVVRINSEGDEGLWVRELSALEPRKLLTNGYDPFWSPDGKSIGFFQNGKLKRTDIGGGPVRTICNAGDSRGATWNRDGVILFSPNPSGPLHRVSADGGAVTPATRLNAERKEIGHWRPSFLPDGKHFLYMVQSSTAENSGVYVGALDNSVSKQVMAISSPAQFVEPNVILYIHNLSLVAQRFDLKKLELIGQPMQLAQAVAYAPQYASYGFSAARDVLVYHPRSVAASSHSLSVVDRTGKQLRELPVNGVNLDLSRDDKRLAMQIEDPQMQTPDIWIYDLQRNASSRLTFDPGPEIGPVWSPDGKRIVYITPRDGKPTITMRPASGGGREETVFRLENWAEVIDWSRDGRHLLIEEFPIESKGNLSIFDLTTKQLTRIIDGEGAEHSGRFSPDGKLIAYVSDETGREEVYLQTFPITGSRWQVSSKGGSRPRWAANSSELFFATHADILSVRVNQNGSEVTLGPIEPRFKAEHDDFVMNGKAEEFIMARRGVRTFLPIVVLTEWQRKFPAPSAN